MDDNKVLTLASNERIALTKDMRLLFEVGHLQSATPATVSRGIFNYYFHFTKPVFKQFIYYIHSWYIIC